MKDYVEYLDEEKILEFPPYDIEKITKDELINEETFRYIYAIPDRIDREKVLILLEEKAKEHKCLSNFRRLLKQYKMYFSENKELKHNEVADILLEENHFAIYDNTIYFFIDGVYKSDKKFIEKEMIKYVPNATSYFMNEVYRNLELKIENEKIDFNRENGVINFKNGLYFLDKKELWKHSPYIFSNNQINVNYNGDAIKIKAVDDFLDKISSYKKERKQTILEMIGYCMTTSINLQKVFILYGETARNGKSTLSNIITELIGRENVSNISLKDMTRNTFATFGIKDKLLNIGAEMTEDFLEDMSTFKMFATGDNLSVEDKFKTKQFIKPYAKFIFIANELPSVADKTNAFYRRLQIIPLEKSFTDEEANNFNINELLTKEALEYLAKISLEAYSNMNGRFSNYEESEKEVDKYRLSSNSVKSFINDTECMYKLFGSNRKKKATDVYDSYKEYCSNNTYRAIGRNKFYKEIEKNTIFSIIEENHQKMIIVSRKNQ